jgi:hypothetical protein
MTEIIPTQPVESKPDAAADAQPQAEAPVTAKEKAEEEKKVVETPAPKPEPLQPPAEALPIKTKPEGFFAKIFDPGSKLGRFNRAFLRWLAAIVGLFALGLLATYLLLVKPLQGQLDATQTELQDTLAQLDSVQADLANLQQEKTTLDEDYQASQDALELANNQVVYLNIKSGMLKARLALKSAAGGPDALEALKQAQTDLEVLLPFIQAQDPNLADLLSSRMEVAIAEVKRDPVEAPEAVDDAYTRLLDLEEFLFE